MFVRGSFVVVGGGAVAEPGEQPLAAGQFHAAFGVAHPQLHHPVADAGGQGVDDRPDRPGLPRPGGGDQQQMRAEQTEPVDQPVLATCDRQSGHVRRVLAVQGCDGCGEWVVHQEPEDEPVAVGGVGADPAVGGVEGLRQPLDDVGVVLGHLPGQHPHGHPVHRVGRGDLDEFREVLPSVHAARRSRW